MRLGTHLVLAALALVDLALAYPSTALPRRDTGRPDPLPPESTGHGTLIHRAPITADNASIPLPPPSIPSSPPITTLKPMDLAISYALSDSCLLYLNSVMQSPTFKSCLPFSLLLTTSTSYASLLSASRASGSLDTLNQLLAYTSSPQPSSDTCDQYFSGVYDALSSKNNCAADMPRAGTTKAVAKEIKTSMGNYQLMRQAAAITDPDTGKYCYLQAITNPSPDDLYLWSLPAGISLPPSSTPTCSKCSSLLLNHYAGSLDTAPNLNGTTLQTAISTINNQCGAAFATYSAAVPGAAGRLHTIDWTLGLAAAGVGLLGMMI